MQTLWDIAETVLTDHAPAALDAEARQLLEHALRSDWYVNLVRNSVVLDLSGRRNFRPVLRGSLNVANDVRGAVDILQS